MCSKHKRRCADLRLLHEQALQEWTRAETYEQVRAAWARLGGLTTLHRYGRQHFALLARHRHGDPEALQLLCARMQRREQARDSPERPARCPFEGQPGVYCDNPVCPRCYPY